MCDCTRELRSMASRPCMTGRLVPAGGSGCLGPTEYRVQRIAQFVRQHRQELLLEPVAALGLGARGTLTGQQPLALALELAAAR